MGGVFDQMFATDEVKKRILRTYESLFQVFMIVHSDYCSFIGPSGPWEDLQEISFIIQSQIAGKQNHIGCSSGGLSP